MESHVVYQEGVDQFSEGDQPLLLAKGRVMEEDEDVDVGIEHLRRTESDFLWADCLAQNQAVKLLGDLARLREVVGVYLGQDIFQKNFYHDFFILPR